jgi:hypothetical protein
MKISEDEVTQLIQLESPRHNVSLFRNNSGAMQDQTGRLVRYGLGHVSKQLNKNFKSSDLIGITPVTITKEMVGSVVGVFTACEIKRSDWKFKGLKREVAQKNFIDFIIARGGIGGFCKSVDDFLKIINKN